MTLYNIIYHYIPTVYQLYTNCIPTVYQLYTNCIPTVYQLYTNCIPFVYRIPTVYQLYTNCIPTVYHCIPLYTIIYRYILFYTKIYQSNQHVSDYTKIYLRKPKSTIAIQNINFVDNGKVVAVLTAFIFLTWLFDCLLVELVA